MKTFIQSVIDEESDPNFIDDWIDEWHVSEHLRGTSLHKYLGFTKEEYQKWLTFPEYLYVIIEDRLAERNERNRESLIDCLNYIKV